METETFENKEMSLYPTFCATDIFNRMAWWFIELPLQIADESENHLVFSEALLPNLWAVQDEKTPK